MQKNKHKYYKVKETKNRLGETEFLVFACDNWMDRLFGCWKQYAYQNQTLEEAVEHIQILALWKVVKEKIVYKRKLK